MQRTAIQTVIFLFLCIVVFALAGCADDDDNCDQDGDCPHEDDDDNDDSGDDDAGDDDDYIDPQVEITEPTALLNPDGSINARGWARTPLIEYNPDFIPDKLKWRKKEWDHYTIFTPDFAFTFTVADIMYVTFLSFEVIDFATNKIVSGVDIVLGSKGTFPLSPLGDTQYENGDTFLNIQYDQGVRTITSHVDSTLLSTEMGCNIIVTQNLPDENVASAAPFGQDGYFFYENKIFTMPVAGQVTVEGKTYAFDPEDSFAILDWGRGVWPHTHEWHWGSAAGFVAGKLIGFNIGDGWSEDSLGTANVQKYDGVAHKLYYVFFDYLPNEMMKPWKITSDENKLNATMVPFYHQKAGMMVFDLGMLVDKMYGRFSGNITLDDGTVVAFENLLGFIEHSYQKW